MDSQRHEQRLKYQILICEAIGQTRKRCLAKDTNSNSVKNKADYSVLGTFGTWRGAFTRAYPTQYLIAAKAANGILFF